MKRYIYFLMVGLFITAFQVVEAEAQRGDPRGSGDMRDARDGGDVRDPRGEHPPVDTLSHLGI